MRRSWPKESVAKWRDRAERGNKSSAEIILNDSQYADCKLLLAWAKRVTNRSAKQQGLSFERPKP